MVFLKKQNWFLALIMTLLTQGLFGVILGYFLKSFKKGAWYTKWQYWVFGAVCLIFPVFILALVLIIQITCDVADKLNVPGSKIYNSPYSWILCLIVPIVGWILLVVMYLYVNIWPVVMIYKGEGEKYAK